MLRLAIVAMLVCLFADTGYLMAQRSIDNWPIESGEYQMTAEWSIALPKQFKRRIEDGSLVLWRNGFTIWINIWGNDDAEAPRDLFEQFRPALPGGRYDEFEIVEDGVVKYAYRLKEATDDNRVAAFYCFAFGVSGTVQMAVYFDDETYLTSAHALAHGLKETLPPSR
jgi:hypothetical protein